ncbi:MAG: baeE [Clostridia bacterium]|jgi:malonyl CoA-acyl carrier protein transacylase|uniref:ACP S-malonyltransferase n=1 Tax=Petroclostridium xylanilyticum TaxID=1792311 RepID=UPI000B98A02D|nr:ACP S-malonyltransferase [Petroclostridium xylanilyticum]MBZ4646517.1 baeE [Clostridia bacterium]
MENFIKKKHAFLFQGVGAEYQRFLHLLDEEQKEILHQCCSKVNKEIKLDLWHYLFNSSITNYDKMFNDWIAIYTIDYIVYHTYINFGIKPGIFLGYSMGLITALACGQAISFESGLHLLLSSYEYAQYAPRKKESMAVIVGMTSDDVDRMIQRNGLNDYVSIASENNEYCIIISGIKSCVEKVLEIAENEGAMKVKELNVPYAFHSPYALGGIERYINVVEKINILNCKMPVISCYNQNIIQDSSDLKKELIKNMASRMYWKTSIEKVTEMGINSFIEVSLNDSLTKSSKLINTNCEFFNYNSLLKSKLILEKIKASNLNIKSNERMVV